ncbi:DUF998 domain-containing protein [Actinoplanes couchii]|uniref:DUF998 domain-containing protein n=1 Tax=Actinoplanes couchii TaxID=403638 RepID=A0ABQ3XNK1_9ACTN|nr:DUF998 domain-containing protein [Actinoplanes couchii]MDR6318033.1 hypothetical protein [Actinoplanes couchii]GID60050.1 hypothetical protein Aco03nite_084540 [Actinoplanes couchii]
MTVQTCSPAGRITRSLLGYGVIAGPFYVIVSLAQALTRDGFRLDRHSWSLLANGDLGWIQIANFVLTGLMTIAAAVGLRRALDSRLAPALVGGYGIGLVAAGIFIADPAQGFPVGTPEAGAVSWHGMLHLAVGGVGFLCMIGACLVLGARFAREGRTAIAWFSRFVGVFFFGAFAGIASGSHGPVTLVFVAAVLLVQGWLALICVHFHRATV